MLEKQIEKYLVRRVKDNEGLTFKWISTVTGVPDRLVLLKQRVFFVELKTETGKLSGRQILVFDQLGEQVFPVYILRSYDDIEEFLKGVLT